MFCVALVNYGNIIVEKLHCIAEIRAHWVETKPLEIDNPRHHYQIA